MKHTEDKEDRESASEQPSPLPSQRDAAPEQGILSQHEVAARRGLLHPFLRAVIFAASAYVLTSFLSDVVMSLLRWSPRAQGWPLVVLYVVLDLALLVLSWFCLELLDQRDFAILGLWFYSGWGREVAWGLAGSTALMTIIVAATLVAHGVSYSGMNASAHTLAGMLSLGAFMALAAAFEEIAFRGYGFQRLVEAVGPLAAVAISAGLFGVAHLRNPSATPLSTANTALAGVLFSVAYLRTRALWFPIGLHWAWNFFQGPVFSLPVSGIFFQPTLLRAQLGGAPSWLTGGAYGPEGGLVATLVTLAAIVWVARTPRLTPSPKMAEVLQ